MGAIFHRGGPRDRTPVDAVVNTPAAAPAGATLTRASQLENQLSSWRSARAWVALAVVTALGLVIDLWSKYWAFATLAGAPVVLRREEVLQATSLRLLIPPHEPTVVVPDLLSLHLVLNPGSIFGIGAGKRWFFIALTPVAIGFAVWMFGAWTRARDLLGHAAAGLILAGGLGNLYDRLLYGCVRDFLHPLPNAVLPMGWSWPWGGRDVWPYVSNIADAFLLLGVAVFVVRLWRAGGPAQLQGGPPQTAAPSARRATAAPADGTVRS